MAIDVWVNAGAAMLSSVTAAVALWMANLSRNARRDAEAARDVALEQLAAMKSIAATFERAHPEPKLVDLDVGFVQPGEFRLTNVGAGVVTNLRFATAADGIDLPSAHSPQWTQRVGPTELHPAEWVDFIAGEPLRQGIGYPKSVIVFCDESTEPIRLALRLTT